MKKINILLAFACIILLMSSCSKYLDDIKPEHAIPQSSLTESDIDKLLNGVYASMEYYVYSFWWNDDIQGENFGTGNSSSYMPDPCNMSPLSVNSNVSVLSFWRNSYSIINQINFILEMYENSENKDGDTMKRIAGTAYYFRAFIYYRLASHYGNVPILNKRTEEIVPISPESQVWAFVESDIDKALSLTDTQSSKWFVSTDAINALAARIALFQGKTTEAVNYADLVLKNTNYALVKNSMDFSSIFLPASASTEIIFGYINNSRTSKYVDFASIVNDTDGSWSYGPSQDCYANLYADNAATLQVGDIRKDATFSSNPKYYARIIKFGNGQQQLAKNNDYRHTPVIVSRIAEMYLIKAEALGKNLGAATLHTFLQSRYKNALTENSIKGLSDLDYQNLILDERRREFFAEGMRWQDIKRTKRYDLLKTLNGRTYLMYYPIPQEEIDIAGKTAYPQNPGYE